MIDVDRDALRKGITVAAVIAVPVAVVGSRLDDGDDPSAWAVAFSIVVLAALVGGAFEAARRQRTGTPLAHGILTAVAVFAAVTVISVVSRALGDRDVEAQAIVSNLLLSLICGIAGGLLGSRWSARPTDGGGTPA